MGQEPTEIRHEIEATRARMGDTVEAIGHKADVPSRVRDNVNDRIESVKGTIGGAFNGAKNAVLGTTQSVSHSAADSMSGLQDGISGGAQTIGNATSAVVQNPIGIALGALAVGVLAGLVVPVTNVERERLAPIGDEVTTRAQAAVAEAVEAGKTALADAAGSIMQSAQDSGKEIAEHAVKGTPLAQQAGIVSEPDVDLIE